MGAVVIKFLTKGLSIFILTFTFLIRPTHAQINIDSLFLAQRVNYLTSKGLDRYYKIEFNYDHFKWDTTSMEYLLYLTKFDTIKNDVSQETKQRLRFLQKAFSVSDYPSFKIQIVNRDKIKASKDVVKGTRRKDRKMLSVFFSYPIYTENRRYVLFREKVSENPSSYFDSPSYDLTTLYEITDEGFKPLIYLFGTMKGVLR